MTTAKDDGLAETVDLAVGQPDPPVTHGGGTGGASGGRLGPWRRMG
jgi:hypothetical protein